MEEREFIEEIDLQKYWLVLRRRWLPASLVFASCLFMGVAYAATRTPMYQTGGSLLFQTNAKAALTGIGADLGQLDSVSIQTDPLNTQASIFKSDPIIQNTIEELDLRNEAGDYISPLVIRRGLNVNPVAGTDVLNISFQHTDPDFAAAVVNQLMRSYIVNDIETNRAQALAALVFLDDELPEAERAVEDGAEALRRFKDQNNIVSLEQEAAVAVDVVANLENQINQANVDLADIRTRVAETIDQLGMPSAEALDINALNQAPGVQQALAELQQIQTQLANEQARYTDRHPVVANLRREEIAAYNLLQERVVQILGRNADISPGLLQGGALQQQLITDLVQAEIEQLAINSRLSALVNTRDTYLEWNSTFPDLEQQQRQLANRLAAAQTTYESLLARKQEIELTVNQQIGNSSILKEADVPLFPVGRSKKIYVAAGGVVGVLLGIAMAFFLDLVDRSLKTAKEAEQLFGYPVLGIIPNEALIKTAPPVLGMQHGSSRLLGLLGNPLIAGAYQMLQANLKFLTSSKDLRTFVVTSSVIGEGASSVSAQLAMSISQSGRRVLLIDGNMRAPSQHQLWGKTNDTGLSHVLLGKGVLGKAIQSLAENLDLMSAGVVPPNPLALLDSEEMMGLLNTFSSPYSAIVIDTPSLTSTADAAILGRIVDGVILVVRPRHVDSPSASSAKSLLERSGAPVLGIVANGVDIRVEHDEYVSGMSALQQEHPDELITVGVKSPETSTPLDCLEH
ncbi:MAG: polysaccharide biosynthesis tyrosine autokinase [Leptolyngbya sp. RL_3_1]|nr:polysaccharide biosynthesis tyrosine autokinase [Leptolyngbya sp. RL_3_1]